MHCIHISSSNVHLDAIHLWMICTMHFLLVNNSACTLEKEGKNKADCGEGMIEVWGFKEVDLTANVS